MTPAPSSMNVAGLQFEINQLRSWWSDMQYKERHTQRDRDLMKTWDARRRSLEAELKTRGVPQ